MSRPITQDSLTRKIRNLETEVYSPDPNLQERGACRGTIDGESGLYTGPVTMYQDAAGTIPMQLSIPAGPRRWIQVNANSIVRTETAAWVRADVRVELNVADVNGYIQHIAVVQCHSSLTWITTSTSGAQFLLESNQAYTLTMKSQSTGGAIRYWQGKDYLHMNYSVVSIGG